MNTILWKAILFVVILSPLHALDITTPTFENNEFYPIVDPFNEGFLQVSDLHQIYYSEFGNPNGIPVLVVHGGPGWGCAPSWCRFFDPAKYHVIMFDQRGAMRSTPFAEMTDNTPQFSLKDMEKLRVFLNIDQWYLFGGSWGSTLSLLYSEAYPDRVKGMVLRGIFLAREQDYLNLFYGMRNTYPEAWDAMVQSIGETENCDLVSSLHQKVMSSDVNTHMKAAHAFMLYDTICAFLLPDQSAIDEINDDDKMALSVARAFIHYSANHFFIAENQILDSIDKITHIPTIIVQGRYDLICPVAQAYKLHQALPNSKLWIIQNAGHSSSDSDIPTALKHALDCM